MSVELYSTTWLSCHPALVFTPSRAATAKPAGNTGPRSMSHTMCMSTPLVSWVACLRKGGDLPEVEAAVHGRLDDLPVADDRLLGVPADGFGLVVGPDAQREAELVRLAVAVGDDDVAGLEVGDS